MHFNRDLNQIALWICLSLVHCETAPMHCWHRVTVIVFSTAMCMSTHFLARNFDLWLLQPKIDRWRVLQGIWLIVRRVKTDSQTVSWSLPSSHQTDLSTTYSGPELDYELSICSSNWYKSWSFVYNNISNLHICTKHCSLQCSDTVGWATGRASVL